MRKLLNTLYITNKNAYLSLDGENLVCLLEDHEKFRIPFDNIESVVCFGYRGCSPAVLGKCVDKLIPISFISPSGHFLAKVSGKTRGNVHLRVAQIDVFREHGIVLAKNTIGAKISNSLSVIRRSRHDIPELRTDEKINKAIKELQSGIEHVYQATTREEVLGVEG